MHVCVCFLVMLLAGCSNSDTNNQETDLFDVLNRADSVKIGNHIVVYNSESGNICYGEMVNDKPKDNQKYCAAIQECKCKSNNC